MEVIIAPFARRHRSRPSARAGGGAGTASEKRGSPSEPSSGRGEATRDRTGRESPRRESPGTPLACLAHHGAGAPGAREHASAITETGGCDRAGAAAGNEAASLVHTCVRGPGARFVRSPDYGTDPGLARWHVRYVTARHAAASRRSSTRFSGRSVAQGLGSGCRSRRFLGPVMDHERSHAHRDTRTRVDRRPRPTRVGASDEIVP